MIRNYLILVVLAITLTAGCHQNRLGLGCLFGSQVTEVAYRPIPVIPVSIDPRFQYQQRRRVAFISSGIDSGNYQSNRKMCEALASQFKSQALQEAIAPLDCRLEVTGDEILLGRFNEREIVAVARRFNLDTIALVRVNSLDANEPMRLSVTVAFVDPYESIVFCSVDHVWDLRDSETSAALTQFVHQDNKPFTHESSMQMKSPVQLFRFAALGIVNSLARSGYAESQAVSEPQAVSEAQAFDIEESTE